MLIVLGLAAMRNMLEERIRPAFQRPAAMPTEQLALPDQSGAPAWRTLALQAAAI